MTGNFDGALELKLERTKSDIPDVSNNKSIFFASVHDRPKHLKKATHVNGLHAALLRLRLFTQSAVITHIRQSLGLEKSSQSFASHTYTHQNIVPRPRKGFPFHSTACGPGLSRPTVDPPSPRPLLNLICLQT